MEKIFNNRLGNCHQVVAPWVVGDDTAGGSALPFDYLGAKNVEHTHVAETDLKPWTGTCLFVYIHRKPIWGVQWPQPFLEALQGIVKNGIYLHFR